MPGPNMNSFASRAKRNPAESGHHESDPFSEVKKMPNKTSVYRKEKEDMDGFGIRAKRGISPHQVERGSRDDNKTSGD